MKIIIDAEGLANARTGIPRVTLLDTIVLCGIFSQVELNVSKKATKSLINSAEFVQLNRLAAKFESSEILIKNNRPSNIEIWKSQISPYSTKMCIDNFNFSYASLFPGLYNSVKDCKNVIRIHDPFRSQKSILKEYRDAKTLKNTFARVLRNRAFQNQLQNGSIVVANSYWTRMRYAEFYGIEESSMHAIWPSVGYSSERQDKLEKHDTGTPYLLCVMSQRQRKKPMFVINGWAKISSKVGIQLRVVGKIKYDDLSMLALKKIESGELVIYEDLSGEALKILQINAFASIFASTGEGFGLPIAESLFYGVPVLYNDLEVFREVSAGVGIEFSLQNEDSLIEAIKNIIESEERKLELNRLSFERGLSFSHEFSMRKWEKLLLEENQKESR
jgi:glycosyltransferase involved in cell wall biosynthesis